MSEGSRHTHCEPISIGHYLPSNMRTSRFPSNTRRRIADKFQASIQEPSTRTRFRRDQTIFSEGENCAHFYMVVSGAARVCNFLPDGRRQITRFTFPNDYFGLVLEPTHYNTVEATSDLEVLRYSLPKFLSVADKTPSLRKEVLALLSRRIRMMQSHILALGNQTAQARVAAFLVMLFEDFGKDSQEPFEIPMSRRDIADYLALRIETVCRVIAHLRRERFIAVNNRHEFVVNNVEALRLLSKGTDRD